MSAKLSNDTSNWHFVVVELFVGAFLAFFFWLLQHKTSQKMEDMTERIDKLTQKREIIEQENKTFECQRIIDHLQEIHDAEQSLKTFLTNYKVGDMTKENLRLEFGMSFDALAMKSIWGMDDGIKQLQGKLSDKSLRLDFVKYLGAFNVLPDRILKHNMPKQDHQRDYLLHFIDEQTGKIREFIDRFSKEMDSS